MYVYIDPATEYRSQYVALEKNGLLSFFALPTGGVFF